MRLRSVLGLALGLALAVPAGARAGGPAGRPERPAKRTRHTSYHAMFHGPFQSSRLFSMPVADTVGAYVLALSGDGSLLEHPGVLSSAGVLAIGVGDLAQLEYRHTAAISVGNFDAPVPAAGVQVRLPLPERPNLPAIGLALRIGVPRHEPFAGQDVVETVTDFYVVARERFAAAPWLTLHAGLRLSPASIQIANGPPVRVPYLVLPTGGVELAMNPTARIVGEAGLVPAFSWMPGDAQPQIGRGMLARLGLRWSIVPWATLDASFGYQLDRTATVSGGPRDLVQQWDIRLGAEVFVPWGALACRAVGAFCE